MTGVEQPELGVGQESLHRFGLDRRGENVLRAGQKERWCRHLREPGNRVEAPESLPLSLQSLSREWVGVAFEAVQAEVENSVLSQEAVGKEPRKEGPPEEFLTHLLP